MTEEVKRILHRHKEQLPSAHKVKKTKDEGFDEELFQKNKDKFPALSIVMNMMKFSQINMSKMDSEKEVGGKPLKEEPKAESERVLLRDKLQAKLGELLEEQQALVDLYVKAARAAKDREEEYRERIADLVEQNEKDKKLMELFRNI